MLSMGTPARCMVLSGVRSMGSNVLKYTKETSLCEPLSTDALKPVFATGVVEEELKARIPHQDVPRQVKIGLDIE